MWLTEARMRSTHRYLAATLVTLTLAACTDSTEPGLGPPAKLLIQAGDAPQTAVFGQAVPTAPTILVTDASNHPVPGVAVTFAITSGGGSVSSTTQTTNSSGIVSVVWTLGNTFGTNTLTAGVTGLAPVTFNATAILSDAVVLAFNLVDPAGDTLNTFAETTPTPGAIDLLSLRGEFKRDSLIVTATFSAPVTNVWAAPNFLRGWVEFDIDDDASTGGPYLSTAFGGSGNLGRDYVLSFWGSDVAILDLSAHGSSVQARYDGSTVVARIPMSLLGNDDGNFSFVGLIGTIDRATDLFPNHGLATVRRP
jgi:hypothetical protein